MGKKARKTRWRTLEITDEQSDSEESHIASNSPKLPKTFQQKTFSNKLPYSSQSTPRRKYQYDCTKSTRSSSTASENKITFNEDEYTRITTPRQDVLFKKGYLSKPKTYQMQTSTGTSTTSASNSTGNGTPDHQSTDLEYDSQFVFPNGFVDHNGIYYVNSFEPYPLMLYNPPTCYPEFTNSKSKRYSTGSLTESTSPNTEEATSQDMSGGETNNVSDYNGHNVFNMVYPGYYLNGVCPPQEVEVGEYPTDQTRKIKKRRRRKTSRSQNNTQESTECSEDEEGNEDEKSPITVPISNSTACTNTEENTKTNGYIVEKVEDTTVLLNETTSSDDVKSGTEAPKSLKYDLKPDAEEFVPRAFRTPEIPLSPVQFIKVPPNFVPIPVVPFNGQVNPAFIPPGGIPINFLPPDPKIFPNFINFVPTPLKNEENTCKHHENRRVITNDQNKKVCDTISNTAKCDTNLQTEKPAEKVITNSKTFDIATVVSKLEEAAKEQEHKEESATKIDTEQSPKKRPFRNNQKYRNSFKRNFYNSSRNSPQNLNGDTTHVTENNEIKHIHEDAQNELQTDNKFIKNSPERFRRNWKTQPNSNPKWQQSSVPRSPKQNPRLPVNEEPKEVEDIKNSVTTNNRINNSQLESPKIVQTSSPKTSLPKLPDQWISVSNRKKRKPKNVEESEVSFDDTTPIEEDKDDQFESYDVNLLVDVIPPSKMEEETLTVEITEEKIEEIINNIAQTESDNIQNNCLMPDVKLVTEIENEMIIKDDGEALKEETPKQIIPETTNVSSEIKEEIEIVEDNNIAKKKSKKNSQKPVTKKVIITDIDLSDKFDVPKTPIKKIVKKVDKHEIKVQNVEEIREEENCQETEEASINTDVIGQVEVKKGKKKKKKPAKAIAASSLSSSTSTLTVTEDAYDILLDTHLAVETGKTNDEISMELNKMIQKGMYSNLEEKMKSLNITEGDGFFKSIFSKIPLSEKAEANGFLKSPDFTKIPLFKPDPTRRRFF